MCANASSWWPRTESINAKLKQRVARDDLEALLDRRLQRLAQRRFGTLQVTDASLDLADDVVRRGDALEIFELDAQLEPAVDQPTAVTELALLDDDRRQVADDDRLAIAEARRRSTIGNARSSCARASAKWPSLYSTVASWTSDHARALVVVVLAVHGDGLGEQRPSPGETR